MQNTAFLKLLAKFGNRVKENVAKIVSPCPILDNVWFFIHTAMCERCIH